MKSGIKEVAKRASVSIATVSRVLNGSDRVKEDTKRRVLAVVEELNYKPHAIGRALVTRKTNLLGVILPDVHSEFFSELIRGMDKAARERGYHIIVSSTRSDKYELESMLGVMQGGHVDGMIIMSPHVETGIVIKQLVPQSPVVFVNSYVGNSQFSSVAINNRNGAYQMVNHLIMHGHRDIAIVKGDQHNYDAQERLRGYWDALRENGITRRDDFEIEGDFTEESGYEAMLRILKLKFKPTAIFCSNDSMALGALRAMHEKDIIVPHEMALAGFDDIPSARYVLPSLTSVHVPIFEMGSSAVERLFSILDKKNGKISTPLLLPTSIVMRESCGCSSSSKQLSKGGDRSE